jgi:hypothetical protein
MGANLKAGLRWLNLPGNSCELPSGLVPRWAWGLLSTNFFLSVQLTTIQRTLERAGSLGLGFQSKKNSGALPRNDSEMRMFVVLCGQYRWVSLANFQKMKGLFKFTRAVMTHWHDSEGAFVRGRRVSGKGLLSHTDLGWRCCKHCSVVVPDKLDSRAHSAQCGYCGMFENSFCSPDADIAYSCVLVLSVSLPVREERSDNWQLIDSSTDLLPRRDIAAY